MAMGPPRAISSRPKFSKTTRKRAV